MKFVILDRDNTLNHDPGYLHQPEKVKLKKNVIPALKLLKKEGYRFIVITNQSGINRGYFDRRDAIKVNIKINKILMKNGVSIEKFYLCPHTPKQNCSCRKPKIGLFKKAQKDFEIQISKSYMIGDKESDILFGKRAELRTIYLGSKNSLDVEPDFISRDLLEAAKWIIKNEKNQ
ncbi:MAG: HAD family hydrolase [Kosmotoga sp.]|jgi:histidinol-phosphate phosphatase family protein|nr:MAG: HAD family hydrolase [Kosmotoga sp.]